MPTHRVIVQDLLAPEEYEAIDRFCREHGGPNLLRDIAAFLNARFGLVLVLDPDIVRGFSTDSSNLPGQADALCRPQSERECAIIFRTCHSAGIPFTISAGRSNLTGSATPAGGVVISTTQMLTPPVTVDVEDMTARSPVGIILEN